MAESKVIVKTTCERDVQTIQKINDKASLHNEEIERLRKYVSELEEINLSDKSNMA